MFYAFTIVELISITHFARFFPARKPRDGADVNILLYCHRFIHFSPSLSRFALFFLPARRTSVWSVFRVRLFNNRSSECLCHHKVNRLETNGNGFFVHIAFSIVPFRSGLSGREKNRRPRECFKEVCRLVRGRRGEAAAP